MEDLLTLCIRVELKLSLNLTTVEKLERALMASTGLFVPDTVDGVRNVRAE